VQTSRILCGEADVHAPTDPVVPWWSFTKTVLSAAVLVLIDAGRIELDQPMADSRYSMRHLLQHTSGLPDYGGLSEYHAAVAARGEPWAVEELLHRVRSDRLLFEPGTGWAYSNVGYLLVRQMIERVTGLELGDALRVLVLDRVGVHGVFVASTVSDLRTTAWGNRQEYDPRWVYHGLLVGSPAAAASTLHGLLFGPLLSSSAKAAWLDARAIGGPFPGRPAVAPGCGLGVMVDPVTALGRVVGHSGQGPGSSAAVYSFPDLVTPRTLAAFVADDGAGALGALETFVLNWASATKPD
jgi:CubicO group peptidase (beta-lactamase class C family)